MRRTIALWIAFALAWSGATSGQAKELTHVTLVQSSLSFNFVPLMVAQTAGYFQDEGIALDVVLAGGGPKAMTGLVGGGGQFSASVLFDGIMAHRRGLDDVRALATLSLFQGPLAVNADIAKQRGLTLDKPLKDRLQAMKGLRIGITTPGARPIFSCASCSAVSAWTPTTTWRLCHSAASAIRLRPSGAPGLMDVHACRRSMC